MSRARGTPYITPEGHRALSQELRFLWKEKRPEVTRRVAEAAALGDRSENAEYIYGKRQLREIDSRIRFLSKRLDELKVVNRTPEDTTRVFFGAWVTIEENGERATYRIVGPDELGRADYISIDAPVARSLLRKTAGEEARVSIAGAERRMRIVEVRYEPD